MAFHRFILIPLVFACFRLFSLVFAVSLGSRTLNGFHRFILIPYVFAVFAVSLGYRDSYGVHLNSACFRLFLQCL